MPEKLNVEQSLALYEQAEQLIPGGSQTTSKRPAGYAPGAFPIYAERAKGCRVWDVDGNEYVDYVMALGPITLGYCYEPVDAAIRAQLDKGIIYGLLHELEVEAAQRIVEMVPCAEMVRFLKGGAEVTTAVARIARAYTGKELILNAGYRGWADAWTAQVEPPAGRGVPECLRALVKSFPRDDLNALRTLLERYGEKVALVFVDVASATAAPKDVVRGMRALCDEFGVLLAFDEIVTGFRLTPGGAQEYYGVIPDLATFAKGVANGMPLGVVCGRREVMEVARDLLISVTYGGECLSLAAVVACLKIYKEEPVYEQLWRQGEKLMQGFEALGKKREVPFRCTGLAPMSAPNFYYENTELNADVWTLFLQETAQRGVLIRRGGLLFITYSHDDEAIAQSLTAVDEALGIIRKAVSEGTVKERLRTGTVRESFRRF
ncbi:MAG: aminotransferase class III-fold pyridoxal phosphate-dependent enzyme [Candidatus Latescibacteria bacterium]|nr:aminotransferase class III-fold pyridoxal phosphate-dependent enzyme [Candidatus Latescibacterota bacterium]